jgi:predicted glycoside hydrolase/deacetylase ChbG (UPF0249 family)
MLIINADDWGRDPAATNTTLACYRAGRISTASAMVFMLDSQRAAELADSAGLEPGLHINFTQDFDGPGCPPEIRAAQSRLRRFLRTSKYALLLYNPFLSRDFRLVFEAQLHEFERMYGRAPSHFDGHQHMHLATNMLVQQIIPAGQRVRRSFSFGVHEKSWVNRLYRRAVDRRLASNYRLTDFFFALSSHLDSGKLEKVVTIARSKSVELMTHAWNSAEYERLMSKEFLQLLHNAGVAISLRVRGGANMATA